MKSILKLNQYEIKRAIGAIEQFLARSQFEKDFQACYIIKIAKLYVISLLILVSISIGNPPIGESLCLCCELSFAVSNLNLSKKCYF